MSSTNEFEQAPESVINAEGFTVTFEFLHLDPAGEGFVRVRIKSTQDRANDAPKALWNHETSIWFNDLLRLADYLEQHIRAIKANQDHVSATFISRWDMDFKIDALNGFVDEDTMDGNFGIRFMYHAGMYPKTYWVGFEGSLSIDLAQLFVDQLRNSYAALSQDKNE